MYGGFTPHAGGRASSWSAASDGRHYVLLRGALKLNLSKNLVFCPNQVDPHPPPHKLGHPKLKKKIDVFFCILGYSKHIIFSWKSHTFGVTDDFLCDFWWFCWLGLGNPCHIATKTPLEKLNQNLGLADPHPPQLGQKTKFFDRFNLKAPLTRWSSN